MGNSSRKRKGMIISLIVIIVLAIAIAFGYWAHQTSLLDQFMGDDPGKESVLYFLDSTRTKLVTENRTISYHSEQDYLEQLVMSLIAGPKDSVNMKRAIPDNTRLIGLEKDVDLVTVNFSSEFYDASSADYMLAAFTVVNTLCDVDSIEKVIILVEGEELIGTDKKPLGALRKEDIVYDGSNTERNSVVLSLYFPNSTGEYLQVEKRSVKQNDKEPLAKIAITELMKGSETKGVLQLIPAETKLLSVETKENVCFVNLSKDFIDKHVQGSSAELMTIYSIVNTLTELDNIAKVQFLIEGQKVDTFGSLVFNEPFERDTSLIRQP